MISLLYIGVVSDSPLLWVAIAVLFVLLGLAVGFAWHRVSRGYPDLSGVSAGEPPPQIEFEVGDPDVIVDSVQELILDRERWIHRRVEHLEFVDETIARRRISIDFGIPPHAILTTIEQLAAITSTMAVATAADAAPDEEVRLVPLTVLAGWPPVLNLDIRDASGQPLSLLSKVTTNAIDLRILFAFARSVLDQETAEVLRPGLAAVVEREGPRASEGARYVTEVVESFVEQRAAAGMEVDSDGIGRLLDLVGVLKTSTLLWVAVQGPPRARRLVKLAYDEPVSRGLTLWARVLSSLGWRSVVVHAEVPHVGDANSYHLEVHIPPSLELLTARLALSSDPPPPGAVQRLVRFSENALRIVERAVAAARGRPGPQPRQRHASRHTRVLTRRGHLYLFGDRSRALGILQVRMTPTRQGPLTGMLVLCLAAAALITVLDRIAAHVVDAGVAGTAGAGSLGASVGVLLLAPGLLAYALTRPGEHPFATRLLAGARAVTVLALALGPVAAIGLTTAVATHDRDLAVKASPWLLHIGWACAASAVVSWLLPLRRRRRRDD
ncbi:MAG TPA: hypothetical protein VF549_16890 [Solirubrobacteraceae bacterium]